MQRGTSRGIRTEESGQSESGSRVEAAAPGGRAARGGSGRAAPRTGDGRVRRSRRRRASGGRGLGPERASERASRRKSQRASEERGGVSARRRPRAAPGQPDPQALRSWRSHCVPGGPRVPSLSTNAGAARQGGRVPDVSLQTQSEGQLSLHRGALFSVPEGPTRQCPGASTHSPSNLGSHTDCIQGPLDQYTGLPDTKILSTLETPSHKLLGVAPPPLLGSQLRWPRSCSQRGSEEPPGFQSLSPIFPSPSESSGPKPWSLLSSSDSLATCLSSTEETSSHL